MKSLHLHIALPASHDQVLECARQAAPSLLKLLRRGQTVTAESGLASLTCRACGIERQQDWPLAPICAAAEGIPDTNTGYWLRLDPVHLEVVMGGLLLRPPEFLNVLPTEAGALIAMINSHWQNEHLRLIAANPSRWYLHLDAPPDLQTTPLDQMHGEYLTANLPRGTDSRLFMQRINELQMLLHAHPINLEREAAGQPTINGMWLWGGGEACSGKPELDLLLADEFEPRALAMHAGCDTGDRPKMLSEVRHDGRALVILTQSTEDVNSDLTVHLAQLEARWFSPLLKQLALGGIRQVRFELAGQTAVTLTPGQARRFWR